MRTHPSHKTYVSMGASSYDEICELCGATDAAGNTALSRECPEKVKPRLVYCSECGTVYMAEIASSCAQERCQGSHEWGPRPLEEIPNA